MTPLHFFNIPSEDELDEYLQQDVSSANTSQSFGSSPQLTTSDNCLLDPAFWINHPTRLHTIRQLLCDSGNAEDDWLDELLDEPFICHSDHVCTPTPQPNHVCTPTPQPNRVHTQTSSSITEPESEDIIPVVSNHIHIHVSTPQPDHVRTQTSSSITEPESEDIIPVISNHIHVPSPQPNRVRTLTSSSITEPKSEDIIPVVSNHIHIPSPQPNHVRTQTSSSITEPESDGILSNMINQPVLNRNSFFATP
ncbi:hypothetical protein BDR05DRAFT_1006914, partial [Suillus weaverae]